VSSIVESDMTTVRSTARTFAPAIIALAAVLSPDAAGTTPRGCGLVPSADTHLVQLDRTQSAAATEICALYLNRAGVRAAR
jgi:hypothetical protein